MDYECGPLLLFSKDKVRMMDLLCDVLEFDVDSITESISRGHYFLKVCESKAEQVMNSNGITFSFKVKSLQEIQEIMNKFNFFIYRKEQNVSNLETIQLENINGQQSLTIQDIDNRQWRFDLVK